MSINNVNNGGHKAPIDNQKLNQQQQALDNDKAQQANTSKNTSAVHHDSVSLTSSAQQLNHVQKKGSEAPVDQEKVDKLKKAIDSGEYTINPESLAKKLSALESEIFGTDA